MKCLRIKIHRSILGRSAIEYCPAASGIVRVSELNSGRHREESCRIKQAGPFYKTFRIYLIFKREFTICSLAIGMYPMNL